MAGAAPLDEGVFLRFNAALSALAQQAAEGQVPEALQGYQRGLELLQRANGISGEWNVLIPHYIQYCRYRMDWVETEPDVRAGFLGSRRSDSWMGRVGAFERLNPPRTVPEGAMPPDADFCRNVGRWWDQAARACEAGRFDEALRVYDAILDQLDARAPARGEWAHVPYHLRQYTVYRRVLVAARLPRAAAGPGPGAEPKPAFRAPEWLLPLRLEIGTRLTSYKLLQEKKYYFLGSINELNAEQDYWPYKVFAVLQVNSYLGVECTWDKLVARTMTDNDPNNDRHTDGAIHASGPILTLQVRYPNESLFVPYGGVGLVLYSASWEYDPIWRNGFGRNYWQEGGTWEEAVAAYEAWVAAGSPEWPNDGYQRDMELSGGFGYTVLAGCAVRITDRFSADLLVRYINLEVDAHYRLLRYGRLESDHGTSTFPLSHVAAGLGLRYAF